MDFFDNTDNITGLHTDECGGRQLDFGTCDKRGTGRWGFPEAVCPVCCPYGWGYRQNIVWEGTGYYPAHGQYHENYDLHPGFGERKGGGCGEGVFQCRFPAQGAPGGAGRRGVQAGGPAVCPDAGVL